MVLSFGQPMIPTFVFGWPTGEEKGDFLAIDLGERRYRPTTTLPLTPKSAGGTNLRICLVTLQGSGKFEITQSKYRLSEEQKNGEGQDLFDFCAECLKTFIDSNESKTIKEGTVLPLGFTVSISFGASPAIGPIADVS